MKRNIIIYRDEFLPYSETFIPSQVECYSSYQGIYVGTSRLSQLDQKIASEKQIILSDNVALETVWKTGYKLAGITHPHWLGRIKALSPDLIHAHFGLDGVLALPLARQLNIPLIVTFHGYYATTDIPITRNYPLNFIKKRGQFFKEHFARNRDRLFKSATCCIAVSQFIRSQLIKKGCPPEKIQVHYIGIDVDKFTPDVSTLRKPIVLFVGRLVEKKGCQYLIQAMEQVQAARPDVELVVIGDGPQRSRLEALAKRSLGHYQFLGAQPSTTVQQWMNRASVLCAPSVTTASGESEGLPIVILEAMAMRLPVVSSIHAGIPEAIIHEETGILTEERDWQAIAQGIISLLQDSDLRQRVEIAARQRIEQVFNLKTNTALLEKTYDSLNRCCSRVKAAMS
jgi:colanic acid/amylovoran biosynthesis glycosyltransferase